MLSKPSARPCALGAGSSVETVMTELSRAERVIGCFGRYERKPWAAQLT